MECAVVPELHRATPGRYVLVRRAVDVLFAADRAWDGQQVELPALGAMPLLETLADAAQRALAVQAAVEICLAPCGCCL